MASRKGLAVIAGVGPGTGASVAKKFASLYNVILLARSESSYEGTLNEITSAGGSATGISTDLTDEDSVKSAFKTATEKYPGQPIAATVFNASGGFKRSPFLELTVEDFASGLKGSALSGFVFAHVAVPYLLEATKSKDLEHPPTLIFTGATASVRGSALFATVGPPKFALRALSQSLAREFGPKGVHVSHAVIDGVIDIPRTKAWLNDVPDAKISPEAIADAYWFLHTQPKTCFTWEVDIRPAIEKW